MVSTEWKSPNNITQDSRYKIVNGGTANKFTNINAMKKQNTNDYSYCINNNGTSDYRASPVFVISCKLRKKLNVISSPNFWNLSFWVEPKSEKFFHSTFSLIPSFRAIVAMAVSRPGCPVPALVVPAYPPIVFSEYPVIPNFRRHCLMLCGPQVRYIL